MKRKSIFIIFFAFILILFKCTESYGTEDIPKIYFEGDISNMTTKKDERNIFLKFTSNNVNFEKSAKIKVQGSSSLAYDKKNYTINLYEDKNHEKKAKVDVGKGWGEQSKYCLKANWIDKTHSRNIVSARIASKLQKQYGLFEDTPNNGLIDGFPVEIYINNEFLGLYTWNIPKDEWMWNMDKDNPDHIVLGGDWYTEYVNFQKVLDGFEGTGWKEEVGETNKETVKNFNRLVKFINESSDEEFVQNIDIYLDKDATINYLLMTYLIEGIDNTGKNMMLVTYNNGEKWIPSLYDLDSTWGTYTDGKINSSYDILPENEIADHSTNNLILKMIKCFPNEISKRWFELRKTIFSKESIIKEFNNFSNTIPEETLQKEAEKWKDIPGYEFDQIEEFIDYRLEYIDEIMNNRYEKIEEESVKESKIKGFFKYILNVLILGK